MFRRAARQRRGISLTFVIFLVGLAICGSARASQSVRINDTVLSISRCFKPWHDGTKICVSDTKNRFRLMTFDHPAHKRWVIQYDNEALFVPEKQGGLPTYVEAYSADILLDGKVIAEYDITNHTMGQEWSHVAGRRADIRAAIDLVKEGHVPAHRFPLDYRASKIGLELSRSTKLWRPPTKTPPYRPLAPKNIVKRMPDTGKHPEVHWTTDLSRWLLDPRQGSISRERIRTTAESFAGFALFLRHKGREVPPDFLSRRYRKAAFGKAKYAPAEQRVVMRTYAPIPGVPYNPSKLDRVWTPDVAHLACASWEEFLLSGDPYHLRLTQFCANFSIGFEHVAYRMQGSQDGLPLLVPQAHQPRGYGKALMLMWRAWALTPDEPYEWLLGKEYFAKSLEDIAFQARTYLARDPFAKFGKISASYLRGRDPGANGYEQQQMQAFWSIAWAAKKGFPEFQSTFDWMSTGFREMFDAYGTNFPSVTQKSRKAEGQIFSTWEAAAAWVEQNFPNHATRPDHFVNTWTWQHARIYGMLSSIVQLGYEEFRPYFEAMEAKRLALRKCMAGRRSLAASDCPEKLRYDGIADDWKLSTEPYTDTAALIPGPQKARPMRSEQPAPVAARQSAQKGTKETTESAETTDLAESAKKLAKSTQTPQDTSVETVTTTPQDRLPDPGWVNLPPGGTYKTLP